jgi:hypothetical protein
MNLENSLYFIRDLTSGAHLAGEESGKKSADYVFNEWIEQNLDRVKLIDYDVYLDYPDPNRFNM